MNVMKITPAKPKGTVAAPPSKSFSHRATICAALSGGVSNVDFIMFSEDVVATINGVKKIGADVSLDENKLTINSFKPTSDNIIIDCGDSGSTLRFLIPVVAVLGINAVFKRSLSLSKRPLEDYLKILGEFGIIYRFDEDLSLSISGKLRPGRFFVPGNVSSQYISGLLMALPLLKENSEIKLTSKLESSEYIAMTLDVMKKFGVDIKKTVDGFFIKGNQRYIPKDYSVEGDWSQAAFFMAAGAIGGNVIIKNLNKNSCQGDKQIFDLLKKFGAEIYWDSKDVVVNQSELRGIDIDASEILDLVPILAVVAANSTGTTNIRNLRRLKFKECDRLTAVYKELKSLDVDIKKLEDSLVITGKKTYKNIYDNKKMVWSHNDHRMVMALSIMALRLPQSLKISGFDSVQKSYPSFFQDYKLIGGKADVVSMGT